MVSLFFIPVVAVVVLGLVALVVYFIKTTKGAKGAMDEGRRQQEELKREVEAGDGLDDATK